MLRWCSIISITHLYQSSCSLTHDLLMGSGLLDVPSNIHLTSLGHVLSISLHPIIERDYWESWGDINESKLSYISTFSQYPLNNGYVMDDRSWGDVKMRFPHLHLHIPLNDASVMMMDRWEIARGCSILCYHTSSYHHHPLPTTPPYRLLREWWVILGDVPSPYHDISQYASSIVHGMIYHESKLSFISSHSLDPRNIAHKNSGKLLMGWC